MIDLGNALGVVRLHENVSNYSTFQRSRFHDVVTLGRILGFEVDHYLLSFDYGLIPATTSIPHYDPSVSRKYSRHVTQRAKELHITEAVKELPVYDLIYLDIPEDQTSLVRPIEFRSKASEIVYFTADLFIAPPFLGFNLQELKTMLKRSSFLPIPCEIEFKMNLLLNYVLIKIFDQNLNFLQFIQALQEHAQYLYTPYNLFN